MASLPIRTYTLAPFSELRIVSHDSHDGIPVLPSVKLLNTPAAAADLLPNMRGTAEIYGRELAPDVDRTIEEGEKLAVFTWVGCSVQVKGMVEQEYDGEDHAMKEYLNVANVLNAERELASVKRTQGPRVLITGAPSSGKSTVAMLLCNYALRGGWTPVFVEADPRASTDKRQIQFYPGTIGATVVTNAAEMDSKNPLVYFYGYSGAQENEKLYLQISKSMGASLDAMMENSSQTQPHSRRSDEVSDMGKYIAASGMIINAPYSANRDLIVKLAEIYSVSLILVIDSPSVRQDLVRTFAAIRDGQRAATPLTGVRGDVAPGALGNLAFQETPEQKAHTQSDLNETQTAFDGADASDDKATREVTVLAINKLEGVVPVDLERVKYLNSRCWKRYFQRTNAGEMHVIRFPMENVKLVVLETSVALSKDALPTDDTGYMTRNEVYASMWNGDPFSLTNGVLGIPAADDATLIPYCNLLGFVLVRKVEERAQQPDAETDGEPAPRTYVMEVLCPAVYSPSSLPAYLLVAGNQRVMRWQTI
ncbi:pre-mRNA cleavage complex II protein Clp1, putative [Babesia bigemina]|uniref:Pre-mRNA cleavage complex II protein Clp1, putative n=1 Tax=Babesia bigemina TaxID=5866 RepID=A0A061D2M7_BABBI|nr:pre-mRNA cleavage complex II protein Clp1, putative [Babesia bigemina]CDR94317.1 pre-mRNA cleavage complex II protein Clp1, putative [Babesia bigemina]|eukprot:XP_012766503.1 pre-mRNA cleavage complex II protein Clp1, putative [Babesia bigemina]